MEFFSCLRVLFFCFPPRFLRTSSTRRSLWIIVTGYFCCVSISLVFQVEHSPPPPKGTRLLSCLVLEENGTLVSTKFKSSQRVQVVSTRKEQELVMWLLFPYYTYRLDGSCELRRKWGIWGYGENFFFLKKHIFSGEIAEIRSFNGVCECPERL